MIVPGYGPASELSALVQNYGNQFHERRRTLQGPQAAFFRVQISETSTRQLPEHPPDPSVCPVKKGRRLGEHQDALTVHHVYAVFFAVADRRSRF